LASFAGNLQGFFLGDDATLLTSSIDESYGLGEDPLVYSKIVRRTVSPPIRVNEEFREAFWPSRGTGGGP